jgi:hypothetical protein
MYVLQRISKNIPTFTSEVPAEQWAAGDEWWKVQGRLYEAFTRAATKINTTWDQLSVTEIEVHKGCLGFQDRGKRAICIQRKFSRQGRQEILKHPKAGRFIDHVNGEYDTSAQELLTELRENVEEACSPANFASLEVEWAEEGPCEQTHGEYIRDFSFKVRKMVMLNIHNAIQVRTSA